MKKERIDSVAIIYGELFGTKQYIVTKPEFPEIRHTFHIDSFRDLVSAAKKFDSKFNVVDDQYNGLKQKVYSEENFDVYIKVHRLKFEAVITINDLKSVKYAKEHDLLNERNRINFSVEELGELAEVPDRIL